MRSFTISGGGNFSLETFSFPEILAQNPSVSPSFLLLPTRLVWLRRGMPTRYGLGGPIFSMWSWLTHGADSSKIMTVSVYFND